MRQSKKGQAALPQLVGTNTDGTTTAGAPHYGIPRNQMQIQSSSQQESISGQFSIQSRHILGQTKPPRTNTNAEVQLNQKLQRRDGNGGQMGINTTGQQQMRQDSRPATTKYGAGRTINSQDMQPSSLPKVGLAGSVQRNRKQTQFQTADNVGPNGQELQQIQTQVFQPPMAATNMKRRGGKSQLQGQQNNQRIMSSSNNRTIQQKTNNAGGGGQGLGSRFRVAVPQQNKQSQPQQRIAASNNFWNQVSKTMSTMNPKTGSAHGQRTQQNAALQQQSQQLGNAMDPLRDQELANEAMKKRINQQYQDTFMGKIKDSNNQTKAFSFLTNIGGKDTSQQQVTLRTGHGQNQQGPTLSAASALLISNGKAGRQGGLPRGQNNQDSAGYDDQSSDKLAIFTNMNVDKFNHNSKTMPKQRVVYLNTSASNKNMQSINSKNVKLMANSKSGVTLNPITTKNTTSNKYLLQSASIDSFQRRPVSGISKDASQSRFRQSQNVDGRSMSETGQFQGAFHQKSNRPDSNSVRGPNGQMQSSRPGFPEEYSDEAYLDYQNIEEMEDENDITQPNDQKIGNFVQQLMQARPTTALVGSQEPEDQLPFPELFDRSERTYAATFAKYGDLSYFTPVQRIGTYMEYQARLKKRHLMDLIAYIKTSQCQIKLDDEGGDASQGVNNVQEFMDHCLFHGLMPEQEASSETAAQAQQPVSAELPTVTYQNWHKPLVKVKSYDPCSAKAMIGFDFGKIWSDKLLNQVQISIKRMLHYIDNPDSIRNDELSKYKKEWMKNALDLVPDYLLSAHPIQVKKIFHDVFHNYVRSMKQAIMEYILRSPDERKRLHILTLPHQVLTAAERQARYGGYSIVEYQGTHSRKAQAETEIKFRLITHNIVVSQLTNWWQEFRKFKLIDLNNLRKVVKERDMERDNAEGSQHNQAMTTAPSMALDIDNFLGFQEAMLEKTVALMKHVWHRGAITIIKKFKMLKSKQQQKQVVTGHAAKSKWTYAGYQTYPTDYEIPFESDGYDKFEKQLEKVRNFTYDGGNEPSTKMDIYQEYCLRTACVHQNVLHRFFRVEKSSLHNAVVDDYLEGTTLDQLVDIRESDSYIAFVSMVGGFTTYEDNGYDILSKEYKRELKYAAGNLMRIQLRQMVDDSVTSFANFFRGFKTFAQLKQKMPNFEPIRYNEQNPHNYEPLGKQLREEFKNKKNQDFSANDTSINDRLAKQLKKRQSQAESNTVHQRQRKIFSNSVTDQPKLNWPDYMDLQDYVNPIFHLELLLGTQQENTEEGQANRRSHHFDETLEFNKSDEQILHNFEAYFEELVHCFNDFNRPEFCKIEEYPQKKYEVEMKELENSRKVNLDYQRENKKVKKQKISQNPELQEAVKKGLFKQHKDTIDPKVLNFDKMLYNKDFDASYSYERYMGRIKVKEAPQDVVSKGLIDNQSPVDIVFQKDNVMRRMNVASTSEEFFKNHRRDILKVLRDHLHEVKRVKELFDQFKPIYKNEMQIKVKKFINRSENSLELMNEYSTFLNELRTFRAIARELPERVAFPLFEVGTALVKEEIQNRINKYIIAILRKFENDLKDQAKSIGENFQEIAVYYDKSLETAEDVVEMETYKNNLQLDMSILQRKLSSTRKCLFFLICQTDYAEILLEQSTESGTQDGQCVKYVDEMLAWPQRLNDHADQADERHLQERAVVETMVFKKKKMFDAKVEQLNQKLRAVHEWKNLLQYRNIMDTVRNFHAEVDNLELMKQEIATEENLLHGYKSDFGHLQNLVRFFEPYYELWTRIDDMMTKKKNWADAKLCDIDADEVTQTHKESVRSLQKLQKDFSQEASVKNILQQLKGEINGLHSWIPTVEALCNRALQPRHWSKIKEVSGMSAEEVNFEQATLSQVLDLKVSDVLPKLAEISENAKKESRLEEMLKSMKRDWESMFFEITYFRDTQIPILSGNKVEEMQTKLDEDVLVSQTIKNSPAVLPLLEEARQWERTMIFTQDTIEIWLRVQTNYLYLWPIFNSGIQDEVKSLLDSDGFSNVDKAWVKIMNELQEDTLALNLNKIENLDTILKESNFQLENIQKNLNEYLEAKRNYFSRFYFLSNEDLIEILGDSQKPRSIQKHLKKCFEGINKVTFHTLNKGAQNEIQKDEITHLVSKEGEKIELIRTIHPYEYDGKVEEWLQELENSMKNSIQESYILNGLKEYPIAEIHDGADHLSNNTSSLYNERIKWLKSWPSQVILIVSQIIWTQQVEGSLSQYQQIVKLHQQSQAQLNQIVNLVREKMSELLRLTLSSLIVQNVHSRDILESLARKGVNSCDDFEWIQQMRYYFNEGPHTVDVKMITTVLQYCNEFLGNTGRLVITSLTDRCYRTLMSALQLNLGGAPEGPAGTGKTETTKDLAKAIGVYCIVFNCADGLNAKAMAKFFKGLCSGGNWSCFDEFNRIELEVLSVIAQQILEIQRAKNQGLRKFQFEGATIKITPTANIFITMNPGYAGRSVLPDNLKALFRPVAMMVPDYVAISEISLYSFGFFESRTLAKKIAQTYRLCSEQLSTQYHYDYGMRAVKSVLTAAKNLKYEATRKIRTKLESKSRFDNSNIQDVSSASGHLTQQSVEDSEELLILKSIMDVNLPKFLKDDIPLFEGIISDLFPDVELPPPSYQELQRCARKVMQKDNLQVKNKFMEKIIQLYDMIKCRHGLMLVGPSNSGKTTTYRVLQNTLSLVSAEAPSLEEKDVETYVINPKSITLSQLYGNYDAISQEFTDGVLGSIFRYCSYTKPNIKRRWIVFDGPVDAKWIENMNTVLDDNKRLCLMNSEIIQMTDSMNMLFETHDLSKASPATISRCGMVYMAEDSYGGSTTLLKSWLTMFVEKTNLATLQVISPEFLPKRMVTLFELIFLDLLTRVMKTCNFVLPASENQITASLLRIMTIMTQSEIFIERIHDPQIKPDEITQRFDMIFQYAMMWSLGAIINDSSQRAFQLRLREKISEIFKIEGKQFRIERTFQIPDGGLPPNNYFVDGMLWLNWKDVLNRQEGRSSQLEEMNQHDIIVPTTELLKQKHLLKMFVHESKPILFVGSTGTGKTIAINQFLREQERNKFDSITICFSAKSSANFTQQQVEGKLETKKRRHLGPANGKKLIVFIDDMNMPQVEKEGAQPPIELLRQWMDHKQWYDYTTKDNHLQKISDVIFVGAMCPPAGGKNPVTPRFTRHFNIITCSAFDKFCMQRIFNQIIQHHIKREGIMGTDTAKTLREVVDASIDVFQFAQANLRPTPAKSHYLFNLRDVTRVISGVQMMKSFVHGSKGKLVRLWVHECGRIFSDRLNDDNDVQKLFDQLYTSCRDYLREDLYVCLKAIIPDKIYSEATAANINMERLPNMMQEYIKFSDLLDPAKTSNHRGYDEIDYESSDDLARTLQEVLEQYNTVSQRPMDLVLFDYAIIHLLRICRILKMHKGNALLIGVGGSGRQSLSYLASFLMDQVILQPEQSKNYTYDQWAEDMKKLLQLAGCDLKPCTFLLTDNQLKASFMLEDVNNLINQYEIPGLFGPDDKILMQEKCRINAKKEGNIQLYNHGTSEEILDYFVTKLQQNLHIILAMSPTGQTLGERIRNFPSLVNCCTLDWFHKWPVEALNAVALKMMDEAPFEDDLKSRIVKACEIFHLESTELSKKLLIETDSHNYVTPTSFLDLMSVFNNLLDKQRNYLYDKKLSYESGISKLMEQKENVAGMQQMINDDQPRLQEMQVNTEIKKKELDQKAENEVEPKKRQIQQEEEKANEVAMIAQDIKISCENDLQKAMPILKAANDALNTIKPAHINEIKVLQHPPAHVKMVLHAICIMCSRKVERTPKKDNPKVQEDNWWFTAQKFMNERDFLSQLINFDKDNIPATIMHKIQTQFLDDPQFKPSRVAQASYAAKGLCDWVIKLKQYDHINQFIKPKKIDLENAQALYHARMQDLKAKQEELRNIEMEYNHLMNELQLETNKQEQLEHNIAQCQVKLERASSLLSGLDGEKERWLVSLEEIEHKLTTVVPDVLVSAAIIAYLGLFTQKYRRIAVESWLYQLRLDSLVCLDDFSLERVLGEPVRIRQWQMTGLPVDSFSIENGIMIENALKWPLMIDPQGQANRWIKNKEAQENSNSGQRLIILKPSDQENFVQRFEQALRLGLPILLESVGEDLDPLLDPVLLKQIFKVAGIKQIKFGDTNIDYADEFRLFMTSRYQNPHYLPELTTKVSIINFMITFEGLSEQLLNQVVRKENTQLNEEHEHLLLTQYENQLKMRETEATILKVLKDANKDILEDENAINILKSSQQLSEDIARKVEEAIHTSQRLNQARQSYKPIADHSAMLFFLVSKLHLVEVMYQYSLSWFIQLFSQAVDKSREETVESGESHEEDEDRNDGKLASAKKSQRSAHKNSTLGSERVGAVVASGHESSRGMSIEQQTLRNRVLTLINYFTQNLYSNVCRSIFEKDKLLFSFLLTAKIRESQGKLNSVQYKLLVETMTGLENPLGQPNMCKEWLPNSIWNKICTYSQRDCFFDPLVKNFVKNEEGWRRLYECEILTDETYPINESNISGQWSPFMKLLILKAMRPDKLGQAVQQYVFQEMGQEFLSPPIFDIEKSFEDSNPGTPLVFILPGTDPLQQLNQFAQQKKKYETMKSISLGQNQGPIAEKVIQEARKVGSWVLLQNCHLYPSWMPRLEQICETMEMKSGPRTADSSHSSFRLWLTSYPSEVFPVTVLQSGIKMTNEPPIGLKSNMTGSYKTDPLADPNFFSSNSQSANFKKIAFGLTMFHAILLQRCNYGPLGWNQNHQFTVSDLQISMRQLHYFIDKYENVPFNALKYLIGQCNYGGRVTESSDQRVLMALLEDFLSEKVLEPDYAYCEDETIGSLYKFPQGDDGYHVHIDKINGMPTEEMPQIFGFHPNADISKNQTQARKLTELLLQIGDIDGSKNEGEEKSSEQFDSTEGHQKKTKTIMSQSIESSHNPEDAMVDKICEDISLNLPQKIIDMDQVTQIFPVIRENSLNTVLSQELNKFNNLLSKILNSLKDLKAAQQGEILMTDQLLTTRQQLIMGFVPDVWLEVSYPNLKPLASYIRDLNLRIGTLQKWVSDQRPPEVFWLSGFFFTQSFLTALLQNYARKYQIEIDALQFEFTFTNKDDPTDHEQEIFNMHTAAGRGLQISEPADGALISGLYFEGCRWDYNSKCIAEQQSKQLFSKVPIIWLKPKEQIIKQSAELKTQKDKQSKFVMKKLATQPTTQANKTQSFPGHRSLKTDTRINEKIEGVGGGGSTFEPPTISETSQIETAQQEEEQLPHYECPLYRTSARYGVLSTTGHSTNFIIMIQTPLPTEHGDEVVSQKTKRQDRAQSNHWIKRGAAMICSMSH